jgi:YD repeat-containing protein
VVPAVGADGDHQQPRLPHQKRQLRELELLHIEHRRRRHRRGRHAPRAAQFDTASFIPTDSQILYGALRMNLSSTRSTATSIGLYRLTRTFTSAATWDKYNGTNSWTTPGGDYDATPIETNTNVVGAAGTSQWWHLTDLVRTWVEGTTTNYGLLLRATSETTGSFTQFKSSEAANGGSTAPILEVIYKLRAGILPQYVVDSQALSDLTSIGFNVAVGNVLAQASDLHIAGTGLDLDVSRTFNSFDNLRTGAFGKGWVMNTGPDVGLDIYSNFGGADGSVAFYGPTGYAILFPKKPDGTFAAPPTGLDAKLVHNGNGTYALTFNESGEKLTFTATGFLTKDEDANGNAITFAYNGSNQLTSITDTHGRVITVTRNAAGLITQLADPTGRTYQYAYDGSNRLTAYTDPANKVTSYAYDAANRLTQITDPLGNITKITYAQSGSVSPWGHWPIISITRVTNPVAGTGPTTRYEVCLHGEVGCPDGNGSGETVPRTYRTDPNANVTTHYTDGAGRVTKVKDPLANVEQMTYTLDSDLDTYTSPKNEVTDNNYDTSYRLTSITVPALTATKTFAYDAQSNITSVTNARNKLTTYGYDSNRNNTTVVQDGTTIATNTYNSAGQMLTSTDGRNNTTTYTYASGNLASETDPLGNKTTYGYDALGRMTSRVTARGKVQGADPNQYKITYTHDTADRVLTETDPLGNVTTYNYDADGNRTSVTDARSKTTTHAYDPLNRLTSETAPDGGVTSYTYDAVGNKLSDTNPRNKTTTYTYDIANRLTSETTPLGNKTTYSYDANSNRIKTVAPRGNVLGANPDDYDTLYTYDAAGRLLTETDPLGHTTTYDYDAVSNQTSVTDANNHVTTYTYDTDNQKTSTTLPLGRQWTYAYDPDGHPTTVVDANGNATPAQGDGTTTSTYDRAGRLSAIEYSDATPDVNFANDAVGNRIQITDGAGTQTYTYDSVNRLTNVTRGADSFAYDHDLAGNITRRTYPDGTVVDSTYDDDSRLAAVASAGQTTSYAYDPDGNLTQTTLPSTNGYVEERTYDRAGRLTRVKNATGPTVLADFTVTLDPAGNPTQVVRTANLPGTTAYTYDARDRLTEVCFQASCPGGSDPYIRWTYDPVGNRLTEARPGGTTNSTYNAADELTQAGSTIYAYDQNGNETTAGARTFGCDLANRLTSTASAGATSAYTYDGDGNRLLETTGSQTTKYLWDTSNRYRNSRSSGTDRTLSCGAICTAPGGSRWRPRPAASTTTTTTSAPSPTSPPPTAPHSGPTRTSPLAPREQPRKTTRAPPRTT